MGEIVGKEKIKKRKGYLYYVGSDGYVYEVPMRYMGKGKPKRVGKEKIKKEPGYLYYVGKSGYVERSPMNRGGKKGAKRKRRRKK
ncbi:MAG: hypothetical protein GXN92_03480 [Candidatus Micrarchaeota archaeon]|nr:hypothetical protein [Candidatus Micrarchaeota archaeon]